MNSNTGLRKSLPAKLLCFLVVSMLTGMLVAPGGQAQDLTPSVNFFNFDYGSMPMSNEVDSIIAGRYEVLVADMGYGWPYVDKYNELYALDPDMEFYVYLNFNDPWASATGLPQINQFCGPRMEADGFDSTDMYWHSLDYTPTDFGSYQAYATSEVGSRLLTYNGTRALLNNTNLNFIHHFTDYADSIRTKHAATKNYQVAGLWFDNSSVPQTVGVGSSGTGRHIYETSLGGPTNDYGGWRVSAWQRAFRDTVLIKYMSILGDSLLNRLNMKVCINALAWAYGDEDDYASGYQRAYFDGSLVKPIHREFEFGVTPYDHNQQILYPGPTNEATSINKAVVAEAYSPVEVYAGQVDCSREGVENWFNPGHGFLEYGFRDYWYDCLVLYYLWKSATTYISFANVPEARLGVLNWLDGGASNGHCTPAGNPGDSCYWIDALGVRVGRNGDDTAWDNDVIDWYAASVSCPDCIITEGQGKDAANQNYVVFRRAWTGDDGYRYMVLLRPAGRSQNTFAGSVSPNIELISGPWQRLGHDGVWSSAVSTINLENGRGGIFRAIASECGVAPSVPVLSSPANGSAPGTNQPPLCVLNSTPAPGCADPHTYTFEVYSDPALTVLVGSPVTTVEGTGTSCYTPLQAFPNGYNLWWRVRCSNGTASSSWSAPFYFQTPNTPPPTPGPVSPGNGDTLGSYQPNLSVSTVTDADGTQVVYQFEVSKHSDFSAIAGTGVVAESDGQATWQASPSLDNNSVYYWRTCSYDGIDYSNFTVPRSFFVAVGGNTQPMAPTGYSPSNEGTISDISPTLTVNNGSDADGNTLTYGFELYAADSSTLLNNVSGITEGSGRTSHTIPYALATDNVYVWRANCYDGIISSDWTPWYSFTLSASQANDPPSSPTNISPADAATVVGEPIALTIANSSEPDGDQVYYDFRIYFDPARTVIVQEIPNVAETPNQTTVVVSFTPVHGHTYYWRVLAHDDDGWSAPSTQTAFTYVSMSVDVDETEAVPSRPADGAVIHTDRPTLYAHNIAPAGSNTYYFDVSTDSSFVAPVASSSGIPEASGDFTSWQVPRALESDRQYFWRIKANDFDYGPTASFSINEVIFASPNPVRFSEGEVVTFHLPSRAVDLIIQTVAGETVLVAEGVSGEWDWNGLNGSGNQVAVGVYLWSVPQTDYKGKIVVRP